ncbi:MAG TPA: nickel-binding protein [Kiloniellales bacterium]|jgi:hypothetical protein|nr:nickel-binding protein [Kiloniellales bacterium]
MVPVIFDSDYEEPLTFADMLEAERSDRWCMELHECSGLIHSLSTDARRALCLYEAPDAEAVRRAVDSFGNPSSLRAWTAIGTYYNGFQRNSWPWGKGTFAITFHDLTTDELRQSFERGVPREPSGDVRVIGDFLSLDRQRAIRLYETPDLEAVRRLAGPIARRDLFTAVAHED